MNLLRNRSDLRTLLESPSNDFLPLAFRSLVGRPPDFIGLLHYALRLKQGLSRVLILAELANSKEGQSHLAFVSYPELELVVRRYRRVRNWPLGRARWALLPKVVANLPHEQAFDWERWADNYIADELDREARQAAAQFNREAHDSAAARATAQPSVSTTDKLALRIDQLQHQLNRVADALQIQSVNISASLALSDPSQLAGPAQLSWQARQYYNMLTQELRN